MEKKLEIREIDIESPLSELSIGTDFHYSGHYKDGFESGISKIVKFYKEVFYYDGVPSKSSLDSPVFARLENGKLILLGYFDAKNKFRISDVYRSMTS